MVKAHQVKPFTKIWLDGRLYDAHNIYNKGGYIQVYLWTGWRYFSYYFKQEEYVICLKENGKSLVSVL